MIQTYAAYMMQYHLCKQVRCLKRNLLRTRRRSNPIMRRSQLTRTKSRKRTNRVTWRCFQVEENSQTANKWKLISRKMQKNLTVRMDKRYWCLTQITTKMKTLKSEVIWKSQHVCLVANIQAMERIMQLSVRKILGKLARHRRKK